MTESAATNVGIFMAVVNLNEGGELHKTQTTKGHLCTRAQSATARTTPVKYSSGVSTTNWEMPECAVRRPPLWKVDDVTAATDSQRKLRLSRRSLLSGVVISSVVCVVLLLTISASGSPSKYSKVLTRADVVANCGSEVAIAPFLSNGQAVIEARQGAGIAFATSNSKYFLCFTSESHTGGLTDALVHPLGSLSAPIRVMAVWSVTRPEGTFLVVHLGSTVRSISVEVRSSKVKVWPVKDGFTIISIAGSYVPSIADRAAPSLPSPTEVGEVIGFGETGHRAAALPILICRGVMAQTGNGCPAAH